MNLNIEAKLDWFLKEAISILFPSHSLNKVYIPMFVYFPIIFCTLQKHVYVG